MKMLIANLAWIDNGWTAIENKTISGHKYVKEGGIAHESLNFKFDGAWNTDDYVYGFCQFTNPPKLEGNDNIIVFYSNKKIVGLYSNVEYGKFEPKNKPSEIEYFNLKASRKNSFKLNEYIEFNPEKYLPNEKKKIGQVGFTYIEKEQLINILDDMQKVNQDLYYEIYEIKEKLGVVKPLNWNEFIKTIDFEKIKNIKKQVKDENLEEGLRIFSFLKKFRDNLTKVFPELSKYKKGNNSYPTQPQWSDDNGFRVGFYYGDKNYMPSTQLNITLGASWGGGIFIKDNKGFIFNNKRFLEFLKIKYSELDFNEKERHIGALWFKNSIDSIPDEKEVLKAFKKLLKIFEIMVKVNKMEQKVKLLESRKQIILQGPPGTGKTRLAKQIARYMVKGEIEPKIDDIKDQVKLIQFHPSYSYEDFVRGIVATPTDDGKGVKYETKNKILVKMANDAIKALGEKYFHKDTNQEEKNNILQNSKKFILIIDEINRANLSSVLGELIYALEYRDEVVESMYELNGNKEIILPSNLYIIGTMNTADRSIGHIDYAIRRRFAFESVLPDIEAINIEEGKILFEKVEKLFKKDDGQRADTLSSEFNPDNVILGHSYFIAKDIDELRSKLKYQIKPLLFEYIEDGILTEDAKKEVEKLEIESSN